MDKPPYNRTTKVYQSLGHLYPPPHDVQRNLNLVPLYAAPQPAPARVPLTDAQIDQIRAKPECWEHVGQRIEFRHLPFARAIEAAQGITAQGEPK